MEHESDGDSNYNWCTWNDPHRLSKRAGEVRNQNMSQAHSNYSIVEVGQNTEKSQGDIRTLAVTQTPEKDYQLTLVWITHKE